jgi:hypothetical protein
MRCPVCEHSCRDQIEADIAGRVGSYKDIAYRYRAHGLLKGEEIGRHARHGRPHLKPGRPCTICEHRRRAEIERAVLGQFDTKVTIARKHGVHIDAISRHLDRHVTADEKKEILLEVKRDKEAAIGVTPEEEVDITTGLQRIVREIDQILQRAKAAGDDGMALASLRDMRATLMDLAKLYGKLREVSTVEVKILDAPQWLQLRAILVEVFNDHPAAGAAFLKRTRHLKLLSDDRPAA